MKREFIVCSYCNGKRGHLEDYYCPYKEEESNRWIYCSSCNGNGGSWEWVD